MNSKTFLISTLIIAITFALGLWAMNMFQTKDRELIEAQEALIESQQTVIDINEGFVRRLVLQNNEHAQEAADYRSKWLEEVE